MSDIITASNVHELFEYVDGALHWRIRPAYKVKVGSPAGTIATRCHVVAYQGKFYQRSRLVWLMHHGAWPEGTLQHLDGDPFNDRIENMRDGTAPERVEKNPALGVQRYKTKSGDRYRVMVAATYSSLAIAEAAAKAARTALNNAAVLSGNAKDIDGGGLNV